MEILARMEPFPGEDVYLCEIVFKVDPLKFNSLESRMKLSEDLIDSVRKVMEGK